MKKIIFILTAGIFLISCNNADEATTAAHPMPEETTAGTILDYTNMPLGDQEADIQSRIESLRTKATNMNQDDKSVYDSEINNLEAQLKDFQEKRAASENDKENLDLKTEVQKVADEIRTTSDNLKAKAETAQRQVQDTKDNVKEEITETKDEIKADVKETKEDVKSAIQEKKEDIKSDIKEKKNNLKENIKEKKQDIKSDIKEGAKDVKEDIKGVLGK